MFVPLTLINPPKKTSQTLCDNKIDVGVLPGDPDCVAHIRRKMRKLPRAISHPWSNRTGGSHVILEELEDLFYF